MTDFSTPAIPRSDVKGHTFYEYLSIRFTLFLSAILFDLFREFILNGKLSNV